MKTTNRLVEKFSTLMRQSSSNSKFLIMMGRVRTQQPLKSPLQSLTELCPKPMRLKRQSLVGCAQIPKLERRPNNKPIKNRSEMRAVMLMQMLWTTRWRILCNLRLRLSYLTMSQQRLQAKEMAWCVGMPPTQTRVSCATTTKTVYP